MLTGVYKCDNAMAISAILIFELLDINRHSHVPSELRRLIWCLILGTCYNISGRMNLWTIGKCFLRFVSKQNMSTPIQNIIIYYFYICVWLLVHFTFLVMNIYEMIDTGHSLVQQTINTLKQLNVKGLLNTTSLYF